MRAAPPTSRASADRAGLCLLPGRPPAVAPLCRRLPVPPLRSSRLPGQHRASRRPTATDILETSSSFSSSFSSSSLLPGGSPRARSPPCPAPQRSWDSTSGLPRALSLGRVFRFLALVLFFLPFLFSSFIYPPFFNFFFYFFLFPISCDGWQPRAPPGQRLALRQAARPAGHAPPPEGCGRAAPGRRLRRRDRGCPRPDRLSPDRNRGDYSSSRVPELGAEPLDPWSAELPSLNGSLRGGFPHPSTTPASGWGQESLAGHRG